MRELNIYMMVMTPVITIGILLLSLFKRKSGGFIVHGWIFWTTVLFSVVILPAHSPFVRENSVLWLVRFFTFYPAVLLAHLLAFAAVVQIALASRAPNELGNTGALLRIVVVVCLLIWCAVMPSIF